MYRLTYRVLSGGERVPMLLDNRGLPLFYPTLFATSRLRNGGAAVNTISNKLADIRVLLYWEEIAKRDLITEISRDEFPSLPDIMSLRDFAKRDMREVAFAKSKGHTPPRKVVSIFEASIGSSPVQKSIGGRQHYNRMSTFADYLEFVAAVVTQHKNSAPIADKIAQMSKSIRKHRPRGQGARGSEDLHDRSPPTELVERFMAIGAENHPQNPFRGAGIRLRNSIIFDLLRFTGIRRGELLSLRMDQFELGHEPIVTIRRNQDDIHDSRRNQPASKTKERMLPLPADVANKIQRYMLEVRAKIAPARRHPYFLVSHRKDRTFGNPLSLSSLSSQIFLRMRDVDSDFKKITPHAFRHHFNYELSVSIDRHNAKSRRVGDESATRISEARELDIRAQLNGHRSKESGNAYNHRHVKEISDKAARQIQGGLVSSEIPGKEST